VGREAASLDNCDKFCKIRIIDWGEFASILVRSPAEVLKPLCADACPTETNPGNGIEQQLRRPIMGTQDEKLVRSGNRYVFFASSAFRRSSTRNANCWTRKLVV